jgi:hypothetical protein
MYALQIYDYDLFTPAGTVTEMNAAEAAAWLDTDPRHALILRPGKPGRAYKPGRRQAAVYRAATADLRDTDRYILQGYPAGAGKVYDTGYAAVMAGCEMGYR